MKDIIIVADFCSSFDGNSNNRFLYIGTELIKMGQNVEIVTSDFNHSDKEYFTPLVTNYNGVKVTMLHEPFYPKNICIKRFISHFVWGGRVLKYIKKRKKPDSIYCAIPTLRAAGLVGSYCKKNNIKFIIDVQDLWPEAFKMVFDLPLISSILFFPFFSYANKAYKKADEVFAVSKTYVNRVLSVNKTKKGHSVFIGTDLDTFDYNVNSNELLEKKENELWLGYCGTLGSSYDLKTVFNALRKCHYHNLKFIIMGSGQKENEFLSESIGTNTIFLGKLPYSQMCTVLSQCDIVINPIKGKSAATIINKHADYAASGKPVINTQDSKEYRELVEKWEMGLNIKNCDSDEMANALDILCSDRTLREKMGKNARKCAEYLFDRKKTYSVIFELLNN